MREANSDHLPMSLSINIKGTLSKKLMFHKESNTNRRRIKGLLQNKNLPSVVDIEATRKIFQQKLFIRPTKKFKSMQT